MIKLSRQLWLKQPDATIADFIERALYNHVLPSQDPDLGGFVYFTSQRPGHYRTYSADTDDFWCCTGTGMESQAKYAEYIYAHSADHLWVDMLVPSELTWHSSARASLCSRKASVLSTMKLCVWRRTAAASTSR